MSDLVERLRAYNSKITSEAANEIERLRVGTTSITWTSAQ